MKRSTGLCRVTIKLTYIDPRVSSFAPSAALGAQRRVSPPRALSHAIQRSKKCRFRYGNLGLRSWSAFVKRFPARSASVGALLLLTSCTVTVARQPPSDATIPPAEASPAPASPQNEAVSPTDATSVDKPASECKGLAEKPCRKNKACTWIIPKEANKSGQVPPAYCRKLGPTKAKAKNAEAPATPPPAAPPP